MESNSLNKKQFHPVVAEEPDELSYYQLTLLAFLRESHPDRVNDWTFIAARADRAAEAFSEAVEAGLDYDTASQQANELLFKGLHFSRLDTLITLLWNEFADDVPQSEARAVALQLLPECKRVFDSYEPDDDFMFASAFGLLCEELTGVITIWLEENGL